MATARDNHKADSPTAKTFEFILVVTGINEITGVVENALYDAGCGDALLGEQDGKIFLDFCRESESLIVAIVSAIRDVERSGIKGLEVSEVRPPDMSTIEIVNALLEDRHSMQPTIFAGELSDLIKRLGKAEP